jgi:hypothetical protein
VICNDQGCNFNIFPYTEKTGENIKVWFMDWLSANQVDNSIVDGITPDGSADGQCSLGMINKLAGVVYTCTLHQLQRRVLNAIGLAGVKSKNEDACRLLRKNNRVVMLSRQSLGVNKAIKQAQTKEGVPNHEVHTLVRTHTIHWGKPSSGDGPCTQCTEDSQTLTTARTRAVINTHAIPVAYATIQRVDMPKP